MEPWGCGKEWVTSLDSLPSVLSETIGSSVKSENSEKCCFDEEWVMSLDSLLSVLSEKIELFVKSENIGWRKCVRYLIVVGHFPWLVLTVKMCHYQKESWAMSHELWWVMSGNDLILMEWTIYIYVYIYVYIYMYQEFICTDVVAGLPAYLKWVHDSTQVWSKYVYTYTYTYTYTYAYTHTYTYT